jgi:hypothetical protein
MKINTHQNYVEILEMKDWIIQIETQLKASPVDASNWRISELEDKIDVLEQSDKDKEKR